MIHLRQNKVSTNQKRMLWIDQPKRVLVADLLCERDGFLDVGGYLWSERLRTRFGDKPSADEATSSIVDFRGVLVDDEIGGVARVCKVVNGG